MQKPKHAGAISAAVLLSMFLQVAHLVHPVARKRTFILLAVCVQLVGNGSSSDTRTLTPLCVGCAPLQVCLPQRISLQAAHGKQSMLRQGVGAVEAT